MPKRHLIVQNNQEQQSSSTATARSSINKVASTNDPVPVKKAKIDVEHVDKENMPKRPSRKTIELVEEEEEELPKTKQPEEQIKEVPAPPKTVSVQPKPVAQPRAAAEQSFTEDEDDDDDDDSSANSSLLLAKNDNGEPHPTNKQYLVFDNSGPKGEPFVISKTARFWNIKYRKVIRNVNPDSFGMYIHSDFSCYGELEVVENCLVDLAKAIFMESKKNQGILAHFNNALKPAGKVNYILGFRRLEALTLVLNYADGISGIDDGDRFYAIMRVIGACYVTILRGLLPKSMFAKYYKSGEQALSNSEIKRLQKINQQVPNLKQVLGQALSVGHNFLSIADVCSAYTKFLSMAYCNWSLFMENVYIDINQSVNNSINNEVWSALKQAVQIEANGIDTGDPETFDFIKELQSYARENSSFGGNSHDLSKWSKWERDEYSLSRLHDDSFDDDDDENGIGRFWFGL